MPNCPPSLWDYFNPTFIDYPTGFPPLLVAGGADADAEHTNAVLFELKGKSIEDIIAEGSKKLASVPTGVSAAPAAAKAAAPAAKKEEKKAESEEDDETGLIEDYFSSDKVSYDLKLLEKTNSLIRHTAGYLLATLGGKAEPSKTDIESILAVGGAHADAGHTNDVLSALKGKSIEELVVFMSKLALFPSTNSAAAKAAAPAAKKEGKKAESEEDDDMGFGLFD